MVDDDDSFALNVEHAKRFCFAGKNNDDDNDNWKLYVRFMMSFVGNFLRTYSGLIHLFQFVLGHLRHTRTPTHLNES